MPEVFTKSGLMLGLGETKDEIMQVMDDLRAAQVDFLNSWAISAAYTKACPN